MSELYDRINELCQNEGISIAEMCRRSDTRRQSLTELKKGRQSGLSAETLDRIAQYFNVSVSFLLGTETKKSPSETDEDLADYLEQIRTRPELRTLLDAARVKSKSEIDAMAEFMTKMKGDA